MNGPVQGGCVKYLWLLLFLLVGFVSALCADRATHFPTNEDLRQLRAISSPELSPDGKKVLVTIQDSTAKGGTTHVWLLDIETGSQRQLFWPGLVSKSESNAKFLSDSTSILFVAGAKLLRGQLDNGSATAIELGIAVDIDSYSLSPDGKTIAVVASDQKSKEQTAAEAEGRDELWADHDSPPNHVFLVNIANWTSKEVPNLINVDSLSWSRQSDRLLVLTHARPPYAGLSTVGWVVVVDNPSSKTSVNGLPPSTSRAEWLHNQRELVLFAQSKKDAPIGTSDLYILDSVTGKLRHLNAGVMDSTLSPRTLEIAKDDRTALVSITHGVRRTLGRVNLETGELEILDLGAPVISDFSQQGGATDRWVYLASSSTSPPAVYISTTAGRGKRVNHPDLAPIDWQSAPSTLVRWERAGVRCEGLLYLPPNPHGKIPMVVVAHGGPAGQFTDTYVGLTNLLVGKGWAVFLPNPRGSTGYGIDFEALNKGDLGNGDLVDIMAGIDRVIHTEPIDPNRLAIIGHSYGGELAAFAAGKTNRFKAVVCSAPVTDEISEQGTEEGPSYPDEWYTGAPWINFSDVWQHSPLAYAKSVSTPVLLLQGENDTTDPPGQSYEFYHALREQGVSVEMFLFPREDHSSMRRNFMAEPSTEPWHGVMVRDHMITFIEREFRKVFSNRGQRETLSRRLNMKEIRDGNLN